MRSIYKYLDTFRLHLRGIMNIKIYNIRNGELYVPYLNC